MRNVKGWVLGILLAGSAITSGFAASPAQLNQQNPDRINYQTQQTQQTQKKDVVSRDKKEGISQDKKGKINSKIYKMVKKTVK